jgi:uncharacterized protein involved in response to NO
MATARRVLTRPKVITDLRKRPAAIDASHSATALLALGFRPFFLLAGLFATLVVPLWLAVWVGRVQLGTALPPAAWHAHEMIFGFVAAVLAGFLLTAVRNWTSISTPHGVPLAALAVLWVAGRIAMTLAVSPGWIAATIDLAFVPALAVVIARPIVASRNWRNLGFVVLLVLLFGSNVLFHLGGPVWRSHATRVAIDIVLMIIVVMGGRVIPSFTENALHVEAKRFRAVEWGSLASVAVATLLENIPSADRAAGVAMIIAGVLNGMRLLGWRSIATRRRPILWVLHLAYGSLAIGLLLRGIAAFVPAWPPTAAIHVITVGAIGLLILGMMSRVSLGHTGRMLVVPGSVAVAFGLLFIAAAVRGIGPLVAPSAYLAEMIVSGILWTAAFGVFVVVFGPILTAPRVDGKPG